MDSFATTMEVEADEASPSSHNDWPYREIIAIAGRIKRLIFMIYLPHCNNLWNEVQESTHMPKEIK